MLIEPDPERAKEAAADGFELADGLVTPASRTDVVVTDHHHRAELPACQRHVTRWPPTPAGLASWVTSARGAAHVAALTGLGVSASEISKVHRPIGLNIGSRTPAEIAIATLAGLIADRNGKPGGFAF